MEGEGEGAMVLRGSECVRAVITLGLDSDGVGRPALRQRGGLTQSPLPYVLKTTRGLRRTNRTTESDILSYNDFLSRRAEKAMRVKQIEK